MCNHRCVFPWLRTAIVFSTLLPGLGVTLRAEVLSFEPANTYRTGNGPAAVASGDFNRDGKPDLVTANRGGNSVSVLLSKPFQNSLTRRDYATGQEPRSVAVGDLNRDGKLDLATANSRDNSVSILLGNGRGGFRRRINAGTGVFPASVAIADVNRDRRPDLIIANSGGNSVSVLLGRGNGTFNAKVDYAADATLVSAAVADMNRDRKLDLVTASALTGDVTNTIPECITGACNSLNVFLGNGDGTFRAGVRSIVFRAGYSEAASQSLEAMVMADVNRDGKPDAVTVNSDGGLLPNAEVLVLTGNGNGGFGMGPYSSVFNGLPKSLGTADVNRDGKLDLVIAGRPFDSVAGPAPGGVAVALGDGRGSFTQGYVKGDDLTTALAVDVSRDGRLDLITIAQSAPRLNLLLNTTP